jgi:hypothetical protein
MLEHPGGAAGKEAPPRRALPESLPPSDQYNTILRCITTPFQSMGCGPGSLDPAGSERIASPLRVVGHLLPCLRFAVAGRARC